MLLLSGVFRYTSAQRGYTVLCFFNAQVVNDIDGVLEAILEWLQTG